MTADRVIDWGLRLLDRIRFWLQTSAFPDRELQTLLEEISEWRQSADAFGSQIVDDAAPVATREQIEELVAIARELRSFTNRYAP